MNDAKKRKQSIASKLALARKHAGLSQGQVAGMMGLHRPSISEIEAGRRNVSAEELIQFAKIYSVDVSWLTSQNHETSDLEKSKIELAARELSKLKEDDLNIVIGLLSALRKSENTT